MKIESKPGLSILDVVRLLIIGLGTILVFYMGRMLIEISGLWEWQEWSLFAWGFLSLLFSSALTIWLDMKLFD